MVIGYWLLVIEPVEMWLLNYPSTINIKTSVVSEEIR